MNHIAKVFISYSHDDDQHRTRVYELAERLRADGVTVTIDRDTGPGGPPEGWAAWSEAQVKESDRVLVACTPTYHRRYDLKENPGTGLGATCEARAIRQLLHNVAGCNEKFRAILFAEENNGDVPLQLQCYERFLLYKSDGYDELLAWIQPLTRVVSSQTIQPPAISWPSLPNECNWQIADRKDEFGLFQEMVAGKSRSRILLICGPSNSGKTMLLGELRKYARRLILPTASLDFKGCPSLEDLIEMLILDLGEGIFSNTSKTTGTARIYRLISDLQQLLSPLLLVIDTYEQATREARDWLESQFLPRLDVTPAVLVIIAGQQIPEYGKHLWGTLATARHMQPIQRVEDWLEFCTCKWQYPHVEPEYVRGLTIATGGNPGHVSALLESFVINSRESIACE